MSKTFKISDKTHTRLQRIGKLGDTFDKVIGELLDEHFDFENVILQVKIVQDKRNIYLANPLYYWTSENYDTFLEKTLEGTFREWGDEVLKRIAKNDKWYAAVL
ncbi:MAG: hypothetical protein ACRD5J_19635, partial [Nitrososphaeraceae archaeon]